MRRLVASLAFAGLASVASAQLQDIPVTNWTVPPYSQTAVSGFTTMTDVTFPMPFIGVDPCRIVDTRAAAGFPAGYGPPSLSAGVPRTFDLNSGPCPGLPEFVGAYSLNVTVVNPSGPGHLVIHPTGLPAPNVSSINYTAGQTLANAVIVPGGLNGNVTVIAGVSGTDVLIDINGYFNRRPGSDLPFILEMQRPNGPVAVFRNDDQLCAGDCGLVVLASGQTITSAILGQAGGGNRSRGVHGNIAFQAPLVADSAGVYGDMGSSGIATYLGGYSAAGVRGQGTGIGVLGIAGTIGVLGDLVTTSAPFTVLSRGVVGYDGGATDYGIFAHGHLGATGTKSFVEPHPTDASKVIRYVSLEGPEAGTYFRGRGRFQRGIARIAVPEDFRMVTDEEGLSVQITPIGGMASVGVMKFDLDEIVVQSSRNLEFFYLVQGVRRTHKHLTPIGEGTEFRPERADSTMPAYFTEGQKRLLIQNGTYKPDGTVNMETAERLGWDRIWAERDGQPAPSPTPE